ncbi:TIGR02679 domain-containing protein [Peribacillus simplex]|uniref:TIGR02679 family protein n=1 Tax=Peribacillus simplex TaxID=1478 RepID=A0A9W4L271_9BACI|nr:TIGR02679 domain-containing protein [Peribacillus simplex]CAH0251993.1 hypothetical protein SRABI133_03151 [Peribacillus simplex]
MLNDLGEVVRLFREEKGFNRLFSLFYDKYRSYERIEKNISIVIPQPTWDERSSIGGLLGQDFSKNRTIKVSASQFEKALKKTKFGFILKENTLLQILEIYHGGKFFSKREERAAFLEQRERFFSGYKDDIHPELLRLIIDWAGEEENKNNRYYMKYKQESASLKRILDMMSNLLQMFPLETPVYLPLFASRVTRNPHALDMDKEAGKMLIYTLQVLKEIEAGIKMKGKLNAEEMTELLLSYNILRDDLTNRVTFFNMKGTNKTGGENLLLKGMCAEKSTVSLPLREVMKLESIRAINNTVFMIENSGVSSYVITEAVEREKEVSIVTGNGMLTLATLKFLDMFVQSGGVIYYAGDFDPEGLGIAQRLLDRYGESLKIWKYGVEEYRSSLSDEVIETHRLNQLVSHILDDSLQAIKKYMLEIKKAGYQENIVDEIIQAILDDGPQ